MITRERSVLLGVTCLGISSIVTQIVTLREFLNVFSGNELVLGLILANWLLLTGLGSYLGRFADRLRRPLRWLVAAQLAVAVLPLVQVGAVRALKTLHTPGLMLGVREAAGYSLLLLAPYCLVSGFLLTLFCSMGGERKDARQIGEVYVLDTWGDILGGLLFSFFLVYFFSPFQALTFLLILNLFAALVVSGAAREKTLAISALAVLVLSVIILWKFDVERLSQEAMFPGQELVYQETTPYGNLAVTRMEAQLTVYENGVPSGSTQDLVAAEETVHYALAHHPDPRKILLISGGLSGAISEAEKYPLSRIDYVELDPAVIGLVEKIARPGEDERIFLIAEDARRFVRSRHREYDAVLMDLADPATAQLNRFYTLEFFREVRRALRPGGVFSFSLSGAENYANPEIRYLSSSVHRSLAAVFPEIILIPGRRQFFVASDRPLDYGIAERLREKGIETAYVNEDFLSARLTDDRIAGAEEMVSLQSSPNRDFMPGSYYAHLRYWLTRFQSSLLVPVGIVIAVGLALAWLVAGSRHRAAASALCTTGFAGMGLEVVLLIAFQVFYGYVYHQIGLIITAFLVGTALGGAWSARRGNDSGALMLRLDVLLSAVSFLLAPALVLLRETGNTLLPEWVVAWLAFPLLTAAIGFLVGAQFPAAARLAFRRVEETAGALYALDLLGACLGALLVSVFCVPLLGITSTCYLLGGMKAASAAALWLRRGAAERPDAHPAPRLRFERQGVFAVVVLVFVAVGAGIVMDPSSTAVYSLSFAPAYHWGLLALLAVGVVRAMRLDRDRPRSRTWETVRAMGERVRSGLAMPPLRWLSFVGFSLVAFYPLFRCYFKIPYLFCHVCPRQCIFGYLRPYMIPAALIMNLNNRHWCFNHCPIGTLFDCQGRLVEKPGALPRWLKALPFLVLGFVAVAYFKLKADLDNPLTVLGDWYTAFFRNIYDPSPTVILVAVGLIVLGFWLYRSFCNTLCPVGNLSKLLLRLEQLWNRKSHAE
jgi:spermidine synthase